ncbi:serine hydrolase domain-containing protein [Maribacter sp. IgM3_T14_3]|uniref:serine hydrolase domain-containing protein n=1 Tax=Maribacter sp. IgM3_T14_3 TaxID=3415140 RepID=UPI003C6EA9D0
MHPAGCKRTIQETLGVILKKVQLMKISLLILTFILLTYCQTNGQSKKENYADLTSKIDSIVNDSEFNGVILVSIDSIDIYSKAIGYSDLESKTQIGLNDQFIIGSISKQITAVLILQELEKGNLGLDDKINKYIEGISQPWAEKVTIHHLLTHTHGISDLEKPLEFEEGSQFKYSQLGYELLAQILHKVTGKTFEILSTELFEKYGLKNTFHPENKEYKHLVKGYEENENGTLVFATNSLDNYVPAGGFISNAMDLKKWNQKLYAGKLVSKETLELMSTKYATRIHPIFDTVEYGYGLLFKDGEEKIQIGALGYSPGFVSACYFYPQTKINVVVLENTARDLDDFKSTFKIQTEIMGAVKKRTPNNGYSK